MNGNGPEGEAWAADGKDKAMVVGDDELKGGDEVEKEGVQKTEGNVLEVEDLKKYYKLKGELFSKPRYVKAIAGVSFNIKPGEMMGMVGETGCGKTVVARLIVRVEDPTGGAIRFHGVDIAKMKGKKLRQFRKNAQMIFQDPYASLNPRMTVLQSVSEPLFNYGMRKEPEKVYTKVVKALEDAGLLPVKEYLERFPHELSGGERQRVSIARAIILKPSFIIADEPVSMLDVSIRAGIMQLLLSLREEYGIACLLITHDFSVARYVCDNITVMYLGRFVEKAETEELIQNPIHPYTKALLQAVPVADPTREKEELPISGDIPSPIDTPSGCVFRTRCPYAIDSCADSMPELVEMRPGHKVACHRVARGEI